MREGTRDLRTLDLSSTKVTDAGLSHLKGLTNLNTLSLFGTKVTDAGMVHLTGLTNLSKLRLWDSGHRRRARPSDGADKTKGTQSLGR